MVFVFLLTGMLRALIMGGLMNWSNPEFNNSTPLHVAVTSVRSSICDLQGLTLWLCTKMIFFQCSNCQIYSVLDPVQICGRTDRKCPSKQRWWVVIYSDAPRLSLHNRSVSLGHHHPFVQRLTRRTSRPGGAHPSPASFCTPWTEVASYTTSLESATWLPGWCATNKMRSDIHT